MLILKGNQPLALQAARVLLSGTEFIDSMNVNADVLPSQLDGESTGHQHRHWTDRR